jgi:antibiotic biosynthesis monooxygenase (ABM) superfamily enzyme
MSPSNSSTILEVRDTQASSVIVHRVPAESVHEFLEWEQRVSEAAKKFPGYRATDIYPPDEASGVEWVVIIHFERARDLKSWLDSPVRADWMARLPRVLRDYRLKTLPSGFGPWFAAQLDQSETRPASWKMALTVLLGLYPTVMLLDLAVGPLLSHLGRAGGMLVGNALSVSILQWGVMPPLQRLLSPWLNAGPNSTGRQVVGWVVLIVLVLALQVVLFQRIRG